MAQQGDLHEALGGDLLHLADDLAGVDAALSAPNKGDDAESAEFVAAADDGDPGVGAVAADGIDADVVLGPIEADVEKRF